MPTHNVNLTEHFDHLIDGAVSGRFGNASEIEWLQGAAKEGFDALDRGEGLAFQTIDDFDAYVDRIGSEVSAEIALERKHG